MSLAIRKILYPTDFSRASQEALIHAMDLARRHDAELHLLHALVLHEEDPTLQHFPETREIVERLFELADADLKKQIKADETLKLVIREATRRGYSAPEVILDYADEIDADLIVMGTHGRRGPARFFLGSVAEAVIRHSTCPVISLRSKGKGPRREAVEQILVPVDFSEHSRQALLHAKEMAKSYGARIQLLYVTQIVTHPYFYVPTRVELWEIRRSRAAEALEKLGQEVLGDEVSWETFVGQGRPASEIARFAEDRGSDLVVIGTHGLSGLERVVMGSTTAEVVRGVSCPVFTVKSHGKSLLQMPPGETAAEWG